MCPYIIPVLSERVAYGEVESESVPVCRDVVVTGLACVVRGVDAYTEVEAKNEELKVVAEAEACTERQLVEEVAEFELAAWMGVIGTEQPNIACVEEEGATELAYTGEAPLDVGL